MALVDLVQQAQRLFNQTQVNQDGGSTANRPHRRSAAQSSGANGPDEFQRSAGNSAKDAGLFEVKRQAVFSTALTVVLQQGQGAQEPATTPEPAPAATEQTNPSAINAAISNVAASAGTRAADTANADVQAELQDLNNALAALGLSESEINVVDRVAQLIKNFSAGAFTSLVNQLQVLAQDSGQGATTNVPTAATPTTAAANGAAQTGPNGGGFTIETLSIRFAGVNEILQQNGKGNNGGATAEISAFTLQVSEAKLTLNNPATGLTAQIQVPQAATGTTTQPLAAAAAA